MGQQWVKATGIAEWRIASSVVFAPTWERSTSTPTRFHLVDDVPSEVREPAVARLPAPGPDEVLGVVGELHDPHPEGREDLHEVRPGSSIAEVFCHPRMIPTRPSRLARSMSSAVVHLGDEVVVLPEPALPLGDVLHRPPEAFPHRAGAVHGGEPAPVHRLEHGAAPAADDEAVDDDRVVVQFLRFVHVLHYPRRNRCVQSDRF